MISRCEVLFIILKFVHILDIPTYEYNDTQQNRKQKRKSTLL